MFQMNGWLVWYVHLNYNIIIDVCVVMDRCVCVCVVYHLHRIDFKVLLPFCMLKCCHLVVFNILVVRCTRNECLCWLLCTTNFFVLFFYSFSVRDTSKLFLCVHKKIRETDVRFHFVSMSRNVVVAFAIARIKYHMLDMPVGDWR